MRWRGQNLISKEDFAGAMEKLSNPRDGEQFRENARVAFGDDFEQVLGYLLGDVHPNRRERVQSILKVVHPYDVIHQNECSLSAWYMAPIPTAYHPGFGL